MKITILVLIQTINHISFAGALIYCAIDVHSWQSKLCFLVLIISTLVRTILDKIYGEDSNTFLDSRFATIIIYSLLLVLAIVMYVQLREDLSVFYIIIFGFFISQNILRSYREGGQKESGDHAK